MMTSMLTVRNIEAGARMFNIWNVNEDAEYHESGHEGESAMAAPETARPLSDGEVAALTSMRDVPQRVDKAA